MSNWLLFTPRPLYSITPLSLPIPHFFSLPLLSSHPSNLHFPQILSFPFTNMSEFSSKKKKIDHLSSLLLSDFILFCSFIFSHPLYLSYFIFFSPYLFKILSFLSPLFITTSLLLLSLFTLLPLEKFSESNVSSLLLTAYQNLVERFKSDADDEFQCYVALQVYEIVFENQDEESSLQFQPVDTSSDQFPETEKNAEVHHVEEVKSFREFLEEKEVFEDFPQADGEKEVNPEKSGEQKEEEHPIITAKESKEEKVGIDNSKAMLNSSRREIGDDYKDALGPVNLGSFGSMRREKEWTRTLACKLFEERHTADVEGDSDSGEGMDLLWETYEADTNKGRMKNGGSKKGNKHGYEVEKLDEEEDEEYESNGQFCCLQALKLSAGKMHLGMRTPNLMKISKALKGIGWLHQVSSRHGKKKGYR